MVINVISIVNLAETLSKNSLTNQEESKSVICAALKKDYHGKVVPVQTMTFWKIDDSLHLAEEQLKEFAQIHIEICRKSKDTSQTTNFVNYCYPICCYIRYHKSCDQSFRASYWKKHLIDELSDVIEYLNVLKREIYAIRQVCESMQKELALIQCEASI